MKKFLLPETGNSYKANLHCHTVLSDGRKTPEEIKEIYKAMGYSIVAYTDHDSLIPHDDLNDDAFLALHGVELEILAETKTDYGEVKTCHICLIGIDPDNITQPCWHRSAYLFGNAPKYRDLVKFDDTQEDYVRHYSGEGITDIMQTARSKGFFVTYNHPTWSREDYSEYSLYSGMHAIEMFNGNTISSGFEDYNPRVYDDLLSGGQKIFCIGTDDNHNAFPSDSRRFDSGWAFTVIRADALDYRTVTDALVKGNFYASEGPEIYELWYEAGKVHIKCSEADRINCIYQIRMAETVLSENNIPVTEASFDVPPSCGYFRITVTDDRGRHACTNAYFTEDLTAY